MGNIFISKAIIDTAIYLGHLFYEEYSPDEFNHDMMRLPILISAIELKNTHNKPRLIEEILTIYDQDEKEEVMNTTSMIYGLCNRKEFNPPSHYIRKWYSKHCKHTGFNDK